MQAARMENDTLDALGDPSRRAILEFLRSGPKSVGDIAAHMPISRPAVSRHLRLLKDVGLVDVERDGTRNFYRLDVAGTAAVKAYLDRLWGDAAARFQLVARNVNPRRNK